MSSTLEEISKKLTHTWQALKLPRHGYSYHCRCKCLIFFPNTQCFGCGVALGYEPLMGIVQPLLPGSDKNIWQVGSQDHPKKFYRRCANFDSASCNWLVPIEDPLLYCLACRLNRTIPDLTDPDNRQYWCKIESAKRRVVAQLLGLGLPVKSKMFEDPEHGMAFDLLRSMPGGPKVFTGHAHGIITLNIEEADDANREKIRNALHEPYRTPLGHLRHEIGHYYWDRLIANSTWHQPFRALFGDESINYAAALKRNYESGPPLNWAEHFISSYATTHPWEDWAETWAHYLHIVDSLDTALALGLTGDYYVEVAKPFTRDDLYDPDDADASTLLTLLNSWVQLTTVLNELARSMDHPDFYPFAMPRSAIRKLHFIHLVVKKERGNRSKIIEDEATS